MKAKSIVLTAFLPPDRWASSATLFTTDADTVARNSPLRRWKELSMTFEGFDSTIIIGYECGYGFLPKVLLHGEIVYTGEYHQTLDGALRAIAHFFQRSN